MTTTQKTHSVYRFLPGQDGATRPVLTQLTEPVQAPRAHEVLVRIKAVSLNHREQVQNIGANPAAFTANVVPCSDMAGEVVSTGEGVSAFQPGDRVTAILLDPAFGPYPDSAAPLGSVVDGTLQEYRVFPASSLLPLPAHLTWEEAASLPSAGVAVWSALFGAVPLVPGETVVIQGAGVIAMMALIIAVAAGARTIAVCPNDEKLDAAKRLGATHTINSVTTSDWERTVLKLTQGNGAPHIIDTVGASVIAACIACTSRGGQISCVGSRPPPQVFPDVARLVLNRGVTIKGVRAGSAAEMAALLRFVDAQGVRPVVQRVFPFGEARDAFAFLGTGQHFGKLVITVGE